MNCTHCGTQLPSDAKFCTRCAYPVLAAVSTNDQANAVGASPVVSAASTKPGYAPAGILLRLVNFIVDRIAISVIIFVLMFIAGLLFPSFQSLGSDGYLLIPFVISILLYVLYFVIFEGTLQKTPAKYITRTKVVMGDGGKPPLKNIIGRSFARLIPFEQISFLFSANPVGWHDSLSKTMVVPNAYTPEDVKKIGTSPVQGTEKNTVLAVVIVIVAFFVIIAVIGILSSVVLVSLNSARGKGKDAMIKSTLISIRPMIEIYNADKTSPKTAAKSCYQGVFASAGILQSISAISMYQPVCFASKNDYAMSAQLVSIKESFCVDASGYNGSGVAVDDVNGPHCEQIIPSQTNSNLAPIGQSDWRTFVSDKDKFSALFPTVPTYSTKQTVIVGDITMDTDRYDSRTTGADYMILKVTYSVPLIITDEDKKDILQSTLDGISEADKDLLLESSNYGTFQGHMSLDYVIRYHDERVKGKIFVLDSSSLVVISVNASTSGFNQSDYDKFLYSFKSL